MESTALTWEQTLSALLPLVGTDVWATTYVDGARSPASSSGYDGLVSRRDMPPGVEDAQLDFGYLSGLVFLRRDEHLATRQSRTARSA